MKKFIHMEDNGDDTTTITFCYDGETQHDFIVPMSIDDWSASILSHGTQDLDSVMSTISTNAIYIPNAAEMI